MKDCVVCGKKHSDDHGKLVMVLDFYGEPTVFSAALCSLNCAPKALEQFQQGLSAALKAKVPAKDPKSLPS